MTTRSPEPLLKQRFEHPEGIVWDAGREDLLWVDVFAGRVVRHDLGSGGTETVEVGTVVGSVAPRTAGGLVCAVREGFGLLSDRGELSMLASPLKDLPYLQMNDGAVDAVGRFWAGSMSPDLDNHPEAGALYSLDPHGTVTETVSGVSVSNGIGWSPDDNRMYYVDSATQRIDTYDFDLGRGVLGERQVLAEVDSVPDGLAVDTDGCVWLALFGGGRVLRLTPNGNVDYEIDLPGSQVTTCTFGGADLRTLFIAVSPYGLDPDDPDAQGAGLIYALEPGAQGLPTREYGG